MTLPKTQDNILKRRTFAIISHPDAGKTTLTEKLLLYGGAIQLAGEVKARGQRRRAHSDWMKVEQERGISVTASVMTFNFADCVFNLLDTPGHEDFSEDTYRVLTAVDSAVMVLDAAKGIEAQTRKLFEVCRLRDVPIITFINKMDRETRDPFELLDEIEEMLQLDVTPLSWPVGSGQRFRGCWDLVDQRFLIMPRGRKDRIVETAVLEGLEDPRFDELVGESLADSSREEIEMADELTPEFDFDSYRGGNHTPVFFGSALHNFGVKELLEGIARMAPPPRPQPAVERTVEPSEKKVSGFVFKIQANMDPNHRDRIAFMRLVSGHFNRGMKMKHIRSGKSMNVRNPLLFLAQDRELAEEAWAGDIIGIPNYGNLRIGDTLTEGETLHFTGIPSFAPEYLRRVRPEDPLRAKHLGKALFQLAEEGAAQTFKAHLGSEWIVGVAGALQFDVIADRIRTEYDLAVRFEGTTYQTARWVICSDRHEMKEFFESNRASMAEDHDGDPVFLARNPWQLKMVAEDWPQVKLVSIKDTENRIGKD